MTRRDPGTSENMLEGDRAPGMEIHTSGACWSVGPTTVQGHSGGRGLSHQPCTCTHLCGCVAATCMRVCESRRRRQWGGLMGLQCQLGSLNIVQR